MLVLWLLAALVFLLGAPAEAACGGSSPNLTASTWADVVSCASVAVNGDTVTLASATFHPTSTAAFTAAVTIQGGGCAADSNGRAVDACNTIIADDFDSGPDFTLTLVANRITRVTGLKFTNGTRTTHPGSGVINVTGDNRDNRRLRVDHNYFYRLLAGGVMTDTVLGVLDHNTFDTTGTNWVSYNRANSWDGYEFGDGSYAAVDGFGSESAFLFLEDNTFTKTDATAGFTAIDGESAFRIVVRHNDFLACQLVDGHGTENGFRKRGMRAADVYENTFTCDGSSTTPVYERGGVVLIHENASAGFGGASLKYRMLSPRVADSWVPGGFAGGGAHGANPWDTQTGGIIASGTVTSKGTLTLTDSGASFTTAGNGLKGYTVRKTNGCTLSSLTYAAGTVSGTCGSAHGWSSGQRISIYNVNESGYEGSFLLATASGSTFTYSVAGDSYTRTSPATAVSGLSMKAVLANEAYGDIRSNTATALVWAATEKGRDLDFSVSDTYEIRHNVNVTDAPGMGQSTLVTGNMPSVPGGWTQAVSPWYAWSNCRDGGTVPTCAGGSTADSIVADSYQSISGTHYVNGSAKPGYSKPTYPHPLVSCGAVSCSTSGITFHRSRIGLPGKP